MESKDYNLSLKITTEKVRITTPSGRYWEYDRSELPIYICQIAQQCLRADAELCNGIANSMKPQSEEK